MKTSKIVLNLFRAALVVLAYKEITHPKTAMIPPGTGRATAHYLKSCYQIGRGWLQTAIRNVRATPRPVY